MASFSPARLLSVWEHGAHRHPIDRALLLFALAAPDTPPEQLADAPLSRRNAALLALRSARIGDRLIAWVDCSACGERMEFELDADQLPSAPDEVSMPLEVAGHRFHPPTSRHLARIAKAPDAETAARELLFACAEQPDALPRDDPALTDLLEAVEAAMDEADPWADLSLAVHCPACGHQGGAALDVTGLLWEELESLAQRLLDDVHALARAYGWHQRDILAMSESRRLAYLARVQS